MQHFVTLLQKGLILLKIILDSRSIRRIEHKIIELDSMELEKYWTDRYKQDRTGWDVGVATTPFQEYFKHLNDKEIRILIPGAGNSYEAEHLHKLGFLNVFVLDISSIPLEALKDRVRDFPTDHLIQANLFDHDDMYDLILEQTFFCSFEPSEENRRAYGYKMHELLHKNGQLVGLWFDHPLTKDSKRPFGGSKEEYLRYLRPYFEIVTFEKCYNSIKPRMGNELFGIFQKKKIQTTSKSSINFN